MQDTPGTDVDGAYEQIKHYIQLQHRRRALDEDDPDRDCAMHLRPGAGAVAAAVTVTGYTAAICFTAS